MNLAKCASVTCKDSHKHIFKQLAFENQAFNQASQAFPLKPLKNNCITLN